MTNTALPVSRNSMCITSENVTSTCVWKKKITILNENCQRDDGKLKWSITFHNRPTWPRDSLVGI